MSFFSKDNDDPKNGKNSNVSKEKEVKEIDETTSAYEKKEVDVKDNGNSGKEDESSSQKLIEMEKQLNDTKDQLLRKIAEFENYKRRTENEFSNLVKNANEFLLVDLLPVLDDFQRSFDHTNENTDFDSFYKGIELIYSKFTKILEQKGVKPIEALNQPFDVNFHEAMMVMPKPDTPAQIVIQEIQKGYTLYDKVIRHTKVIVSAETPEGTKEVEKKE